MKRTGVLVAAVMALSCVVLDGSSAQATSGTAPQCVGKSGAYILTYISRVPYANSPLRCGSGSNHDFGWNKIYAKHNIHLYSVVQGAVGNGVDASTSADLAMGRYVYRRRFIQGAAPYATIVVRAIVDRTINAPGTASVLGIQTVYCEGPTVCPSWINSTTSQSQPVSPP